MLGQTVLCYAEYQPLRNSIMGEPRCSCCCWLGSSAQADADLFLRSFRPWPLLQVYIDNKLHLKQGTKTTARCCQLLCHCTFHVLTCLTGVLSRQQLVQGQRGGQGP